MRTLALTIFLALARSAMADPTVAIASDSIAKTYPVPYVPPVQGWGAFMPTYFPSGVLWQNDAVGGTSTKSFIDLGYWAALIATHPQFILIQFGANDQRIAEDAHTDPDTSYRANLHQMIVGARAIGATPILLTPFCLRQVDPDGVHVLRPGLLEPYAAAMRAQAAADQVPLIDMHAWSLDRYDQVTFPSAQALYGYDESPGVPDVTHFNAYGADQAAHEIAARLPVVSLNFASFLPVPPVSALSPLDDAMLVALLAAVTWASSPCTRRTRPARRL